MQNLRVSEVFTPASPARYTFVERESSVNDLLVDSLNTQGKQIIIYGHTGCGKTTLLLNKLNQVYEGYIITRCMSNMTFESILLDGFDQIGQYFTDEIEFGKSEKEGTTLGFEYSAIKLQIASETNLNSKIKSKRVLPPQLTPQRLAKFFGKKKCCWVLEDFHKILSAEKSKTSQMMKIFMDASFDFPDLKIVALGAVGTGREVVEYDEEMDGRVTEIFVPLMKEKEIISIIKKGEELLRIKFTPEVKEKVAKFSSGLASVCHQLCLNMCFAQQINSTQQNWPTLSIVELENAIQKYLTQKADSFKAQYDKAIKIPLSSSFNLPKEILKTAIELNSDEFTFHQIYSPLKNLFKTVPEDLVKRILEEFQTIQRSELLFMDVNSNNYYFSSQFTKAYIGLRFAEEKIVIKEKISLKKLEERRIERLLEIIEKDIKDDEKHRFFNDNILDGFPELPELPISPEK
jgi:energy-coupling factor transporter ATP-binding protein EcfA2